MGKMKALFIRMQEEEWDYLHPLYSYKMITLDFSKKRKLMRKRKRDKQLVYISKRKPPN